MADEPQQEQQEHDTTAEQESPQQETTTGSDQAQPEVDDATAELRKQLDKLNAENRKLKDENGARRVKAKEAEQQAETLRKVAQALGLEPSDDDPEQQIRRAQETAKEREAERDKLQAQLDQFRETDTLRNLASKAGADVDVLVPYLRGSGQLPQWGQDDYEATAQDVIKTVLERHPGMKAGKAPASSGNTNGPTQNDDHVITAEELKSMSSDEIYAAQKAGKLKHLL